VVVVVAAVRVLVADRVAQLEALVDPIAVCLHMLDQSLPR
jgi:hypothetical protein